MVRDEFLKRLYIALQLYDCLMDDNVAIAVSGGVDSMVLLHAAFMLKDSPLLKGVRFSVVTIDHQVRPESREEIRYVMELSTRFGLPVYSFRLHPKKFSEGYLHRERQKIWREVVSRYGVKKIWLAHHKDDVIEHVLLQLLRGEEIRGLTSLKRCDGFIARPLLDFSKDEIVSFAHRHNIKYFQDLTNYDVSIPRNFIRHEVIPLLSRKFNVNNIWRSYKALTIQREALDLLMSEFWANHVKINKNIAFITGEWPVIVEATIRLLKIWGIEVKGRFVEKLNELRYKNNGARLMWDSIVVIKTTTGVKVKKEG